MKILNTPSPHFNERASSVDSIIIHYTDMPSAADALAWLCNPASNVSAHYMIDEQGQLYHLVNEDKRAWHAGESYWQGCTDMNSCSVGIELANTGHSFGHTPFPEAQIEVLLRVCEKISKEWGIPASRVLGHSDIAPQRKQDPGHLFPWETLAREGLGLWPESVNHVLEPERTIESLGTIGFETLSPTHALLAFQRHFQPHKIDGQADNETFRLLQGLLKAQNILI